jgi:hypothetical protein
MENPLNLDQSTEPVSKLGHQHQYEIWKWRQNPVSETLCVFKYTYDEVYCPGTQKLHINI